MIFEKEGASALNGFEPVPARGQVAGRSMADANPTRATTANRHEGEDFEGQQDPLHPGGELDAQVADVREERR